MIMYPLLLLMNRALNATLLYNIFPLFLFRWLQDSCKALFETGYSNLANYSRSTGLFFLMLTEAYRGDGNSTQSNRGIKFTPYLRLDLFFIETGSPVVTASSYEYFCHLRGENFIRLSIKIKHPHRPYSRMLELLTKALAALFFLCFSIQITLLT